jgi:exodeoxyribonuclease VII large subunit
MPKQTKSQWDFGELFPPSQGYGATSPPSPEAAHTTGPVGQVRRVLTVGELTEQIRRLLEKQIGQVWVTGEVTNLRAQSSGHIYFTLKDAHAHLACVLFSRERVSHRELLTDGQKVLLQGDVSVYEARGQYQLIVRAVELQGVGALQIAFEKLKQKLASEGLFAPERKRSLPRYPQRIGLVTSPTGAAIRDVLHVVQRRNPSLRIILAPCRVQGDGAAQEIAEAIRLLNEFNVGVQASACSDAGVERSKLKPGLRPDGLDLILVTRGGGSLEDLWAFNEEAVARAIFESALPVVSAVGHEIDFTISDFVADVRVATPSAAAEIITEDVFAICEFVADVSSLMRRHVHQQLGRAGEDFKQILHRLNLARPRRRLNESLQRLDDLQAGLSRCARQTTKERRVEWVGLAGRLVQMRPARWLKLRDELLLHLGQKLVKAFIMSVLHLTHRLDGLSSRLKLLGPEQVLSRGYSITMDAASGKVLRDSKEVRAGQRLKTRLEKGEVRSRSEP